jgi:pimeloyl-ACP methyl ester carboxylesterase
VSESATPTPNAETSAVETSVVEINGFPTRIWRRGSGPKLGFLAGFGGLPRWMPFLDELAKSRTVIVPSLPGFPGGDRGHSVLDSHLDWLLALREILDQSGLTGADLAGSSVGASLAAEVAALWPASVRRLALIAPFGLFDENNPPTDPWAQRGDAVPGLMCADPEIWKAMKAAPEGANSIEWPIEQVRANEAAARIFWPDQGTDAVAVGRARSDHAARLCGDFRPRHRRPHKRQNRRGGRTPCRVRQARRSSAGHSGVYGLTAVATRGLPRNREQVSDRNADTSNLKTSFALRIRRLEKQGKRHE